MCTHSEMIMAKAASACGLCHTSRKIYSRPFSACSRKNSSSIFFLRLYKFITKRSNAR